MTALLYGRFVLLSLLIALAIAFMWVQYRAGAGSR
jgi:hypothetical protein